jgi:hypothetical protein
MQAVLKLEGREVTGATPPGVLVGEYGYPRVNIYLLIPPGVRGSEAQVYDNPLVWSRERFTLSKIVRLRASTLGGRMSVEVKDPFRLYETEIGLSVISERPVDLDAELRKPPIPRLRFHGITKPLGPTAPLSRVSVSSNPILHPKVEKSIWDDAPSSQLVWELYSSGVDIYTIQRVFSLGFLGRLKYRRLVPTRWSITAVDEIVSRMIKGKLREYDTISQWEAYYGEYLGNRFIIILLPGHGTIEWIEVWHPQTVWTRQSRKPVIYYLREDPLGRKTMEDGGYSAAKISLLQHLYERRRNANAVIIREITPSYYAPVGNWHIRETLKRALAGRPEVVSDSREKILEYIRNRMIADPAIIEKRSLLLGRRRLTGLDEYGLA